MVTQQASPKPHVSEAVQSRFKAKRGRGAKPAAAPAAAAPPPFLAAAAGVTPVQSPAAADASGSVGGARLGGSRATRDAATTKAAQNDAQPTSGSTAPRTGKDEPSQHAVGGSAVASSGTAEANAHLSTPAPERAADNTDASAALDAAATQAGVAEEAGAPTAPVAPRGKRRRKAQLDDAFL